MIVPFKQRTIASFFSKGVWMRFVFVQHYQALVSTHKNQHLFFGLKKKHFSKTHFLSSFPCLTLYLCVSFSISFSSRVTGGELFEDIVAREYYSEADARSVFLSQCICCFLIILYQCDLFWHRRHIQTDRNTIG